MSHTAAMTKASLESQLDDLMSELHDLVSHLQLPREKTAAWREQIALRCNEIHDLIDDTLHRLSHLCEERPESALGDSLCRAGEICLKSWEAHWSTLHQRLDLLSSRLRAYSSVLSENTCKSSLQNLYESLSDGYEELVKEIGELRQAGFISTAQARHLKPVNFARNIFHALMGIGSVLLYQFVVTREQALILLSSILFVFGFLEVTRRFSERWNDFLVDTVFGWISRPHERTATNGSTWYVIAMLSIVFLFPKPVVLAAVLTLALADPAASLVGKLWGKRKILAGKTYLGSLVFLLVALGVCLPFALAYHPLYLALPLAGAVALSATLAELFITKIDDNFTIPVVCASMAWLLF